MSRTNRNRRKKRNRRRLYHLVSGMEWWSHEVVAPLPPLDPVKVDEFIKRIEAPKVDKTLQETYEYFRKVFE